MEGRIEWSRSWADLVEVGRRGKTAEKDRDVLDLPPGLLVELSKGISNKV